MAEPPEIRTETLAETENYMVYTALEPDGEPTWHIELGNLTLHFFREEWEELLALLNAAAGRASTAPRR